MKTKLLALSSFLFLLNSIGFGQLNYEDAEWFNLNAPYSMSYSAVNNRTIVAGDNNAVYYAYFDMYDYAFKIEKQSNDFVSWENILYETTIFFNNVIGVKSYRSGNTIYFAIGTNDEGVGTYFFYQLNTETDNVTLLGNQSISLFTNTGLTDFAFVVNETQNKIHVTASENSALQFYEVELSTLSLVSSVALGQNNNNNALSLSMAQNHSTGDIYLSYIDLTNPNHRIYVAVNDGGNIQAPIPFPESNGNIIFNSATATGFRNQLIERESGVPEIVFHYDDFDGNVALVTRRLDNSVADRVLGVGNGIDPTIAQRFRAGGNGKETFIVTPGAPNELVAFEVSNTDVTRVGLTSPLSTQLSDSPEIYGVAINPVSTRLYTAFNEFGGNPSNEIGFLGLSNFAPTIESFTLNNICAFSYGNIMEEIVFFDPDGDDVQITQEISNDGNLDWFYAYQNQNGTTNLEAQAVNEEPTAEFTIVFSDGLTNVSIQDQIEIYPRPNVEFISPQLELCINELQLT